MRRLLLLALTLSLIAACGSGDDSSGTSGTETSAQSDALELAGGATFSGTFDTEPGVGPGAISFVLDGEGKLIVSAIIDPGLSEFACPTGAVISGGGTSNTYTPGIAIDSGSFEGRDLSGVFDSSIAAHGTYSLQGSFDCPYEVTWTATSE